MFIVYILILTYFVGLLLRKMQNSLCYVFAQFLQQFWLYTNRTYMTEFTLQKSWKDKTLRLTAFNWVRIMKLQRTKS